MHAEPLRRQTLLSLMAAERKLGVLPEVSLIVEMCRRHEVGPGSLYLNWKSRPQPGLVL